MKTEKRPFHCLRQSLTGWIGTAALLAWGGLAAPGALAAGGSGPVITVLEPDEGPVGTEVVIRGENFGSPIGALQGTSGVSFGGVWASPTTWSEGEVRVEVPAGATTGPVVVTVGGVASEGLAFTVTGPGTGGPAVGTVSPAQGAAGTAVVIRGTDFGPPEGAEQGTAGVSFGGVAGTPASWSEGEIRVPVPEGATEGPVVVTVGGQVSNGVGFTVTGAGAPRPSIVSVSPELATAGTEVVIRGENFGDEDGAVRGVSFGGVWAEPTVWSEGEIRAAVPEGAPGGQVVVTVDGEASDGVGFTVTGPSPVIATVDPTHGPEGTGVVIRGEHFGSPIGAVQGRAGVSFGGVWAEATSWSGTEIRAAVPAGVESGQVVVTAGGQESNGVDFTVPAGGKGSAWAGAAHASSVGKGEPVGPEITSVTPDSGPVGTSVTVAGTGFGAAQGTSTVSFNGAAGVPTSWSETEIRVPVPAGAATCAPEGTVLTVEVTVGGQKSNGGEFLLDPPVIIEVSDNVVSEPDGEATITVRRDPFQYQTAAYGYRGTAKRGIGKDYVVDRLVFPPRGTNTAVVNLRVLDDQVYEGDETIEIVATVRDLGGKECEISEEILLKDDELPPLAISVITHQHGGLEVSHLREGEPAYRTFAVTVSVPEGEAPATDTTITLVSGGTASSETDYTLAETVTLGVGKRSVETPLTVIDDDPFEIPETLTLQATDGRNDGYQASPVVTVWIYDDNYSKLTLSADPSTVSEPNGTVRVTASVEEGKELGSDATVFLGFGLTATATHKTDFRLTKRLTLEAEQSSVSTELTVIDDAAYEGDERIELLASGDGTSALSQSEILTILLEDDDPAITGFTPTHGGAGVVVTISGDNLAGATAVRFGEGETSDIGGASDTEIQATVPAGATSGPIKVVTPAGTATSTDSFTVRQLYLAVDPASVGEAAGQRTATVRVRVNDAVTATEGLTVTLAHPVTGTGTATRDTDYTLVQTVKIANTNTSAEKTLTVVDDGEYEGEETILLQATAPDYGASREVTVTVEDDDPTITGFTPMRGAPGVVVTISGDNFTEQGTTVRFNGVAASKVTVDSATEIRATVPPGAATGPITVKTPGGMVAGADPFRVLRLHLQVDPAAVEEKAGKRTATVTVSVADAVDQVGGLPVAFTFGGTADRGRFEDYTMDQTVTIPQGGTSATKTLTVRDDREYEEEETITIQAGADGYEASAVAEVALLSDDLPELGMSCPLSLSEEAAGTENILVYLPFMRDADTVVSFAFKGTATHGTDYTMDQTVTIDEDTTSAEMPLTVIDDRRHEEQETIDLEASADGFQTAFCVFSIEDTDPVQPPLTLSVSPASVGEASGNRTATVTVSVDDAVEAEEGLPVTFTHPGTGTAESDDYTLAQTVTILNTKTSASTTLTVIDDAVAEGDETITIKAGATDYSDSETVTVTITDDDVPGLTVTEASLSITEGGSKSYQVKLDTQPTADVTITITSSDDDAVTVTPASLTFTAGTTGNWNTAQAVTVAAVHDDDVNDETATITHVAASGDTDYAGIAVDSVSVSVTDDDEPGVTVTPTSLSITEGSSKSYQVKLKTQPSASVTISMTSSNSDVGVPSTALTFTTTTGATAGWDQFQTVRVRIAHDDNSTDESGTITHSATSSDTDYDGIAVSSVSVSVSDDEPPPNRAPVVEERISNMTLTVAEERTIALSPYFSDPDGDSLRYSAISSATSTVTAAVDNAKDTLTVTGVAVTGSPNPTVRVTASDGNLSASQTFSVTVRPPAETPTLTSNRSSVSEPSDTAEITVTVPTAVSSATTFSLTHSGSAKTPADYTVGTLTIASGKTSGTATLSVQDDSVLEGAQEITFRTNAITGAYTESNSLTIDLNDDDPETPTLTSNKTMVSEPSDTAEITVTVPTAVSSATTFSLTHSGSAKTPADYTVGTLTIASGKTSGTATLSVQDDSVLEGAQEITFRTNAITGAYTESNSLTIDLNDDDPETPTLTSNKTMVSEPSDTAEITVTVPTAVSSATTFFLTHSGSAKTPADYTVGTLTIASGKTSGTATLSVQDDSVLEGAQEITFRTNAITGAYTESNSLTIDLNDDDPETPPTITSINPALQWLDDPVTIYGNHFGSTPGSVSFGGYAVGSHNFTGSNSGYRWSNASISLLIPGSIYPGHVSVTVTTHNGMTSSPYFYTVTDNPVQRGECDGEEDCPEEKEKEESEESGEGEEDPAEGGG